MLIKNVLKMSVNSQFGPNPVIRSDPVNTWTGPCKFWGGVQNSHRKKDLTGLNYYNGKRIANERKTSLA